MNSRGIDEEYARVHHRPHHCGCALPNPRTEMLIFGDIFAFTDLPTEQELMAEFVKNPRLLRP